MKPKLLCETRSNQELHRLLKSLADDESIKVCKFCKFDKDRGVMILNFNDYYSKLDSIISDSTKFTEIPDTNKTHLIITREQRIRKLIKEYLRSYDDKMVDSLLPPVQSQENFMEL